jgi:hypothetical protein
MVITIKNLSKMKTIYKTGLLLLGVFMAMSWWSCAEADPEFVHDTNTISQMVCRTSSGGTDYIGTIYEYDKDENLVTGVFTQKDVEGGYGRILFPISISLQKDVDLTKIYLRATVTYDEIITPSLSGTHDITGDGIIITVKSGVGTTRAYRIMGFYE